MNWYEKMGLILVLISIELGSTGYLAGILISEVTFDRVTLTLILFALGGGIALFLWGDK